MTELTIREARKEDAYKIAVVIKAGYNVDSLDEAREVFLNEYEKQHNYIIAEQDDKILGIVTWTVHDLPKHELAELNRIAVLPESRGKGVADKLFKGLIRSADNFYKKNGANLRKLYLLTHASNERAQKFYKKLGFKHEATLKEHYYKGEDEFVFSMFFDKR